MPSLASIDTTTDITPSEGSLPAESASASTPFWRASWLNSSAAIRLLAALCGHRKSILVGIVVSNEALIRLKRDQRIGKLEALRRQVCGRPHLVLPHLAGCQA